MQIFFGIFLFDLPVLNGLRNSLYKLTFYSYGLKNVISKNVLFYVPHGLLLAKVVIQSNVRISEGVRIDCSSPITIEDDVWISENSHIFSHEHIIDGRNVKQSKNINIMQGLSIGKDAWIGAGCLILPQVNHVGEGAIIGAGSVVTKNVEDYSIVAGNPAQQIGIRK